MRLGIKGGIIGSEELVKYHQAPDTSAVDWPVFEEGGSIATRSSSHKVLTAIAAGFQTLLVVRRDLAGSNKTKLAGGDCSRDSFVGRNVHFGVREHGMARLQTKSHLARWCTILCHFLGLP